MPTVINPFGFAVNTAAPTATVGSNPAGSLAQPGQSLQSSGQQSSASSSQTSNQQSNAQNFSQQSTNIIPGMMDVYNHLLTANSANYVNMLNAYLGGQSYLGQQLPGVYGGYQPLSQDVVSGLNQGLTNTQTGLSNYLSTIQGNLGQARNATLGALGIGTGGYGYAEPAARDIGRAFAQTRGQTDQALVAAGLGNTTIRGSAQNQNARAAGDAYARLGGELAQQGANVLTQYGMAEANLASQYGLAQAGYGAQYDLARAGYQSQIGQAGLNAQLQGLGMQTGLTTAQLNNLANYRFANTAGSLTGPYGYSQGTSSSSGSSSASSNQSSSAFSQGSSQAFPPPQQQGGGVPTISFDPSGNNSGRGGGGSGRPVGVVVGQGSGASGTGGIGGFGSFSQTVNPYSGAPVINRGSQGGAGLPTQTVPGVGGGDLFQDPYTGGVFDPGSGNIFDPNTGDIIGHD